MAATGNYITQTDVEQRLTAALVLRIYNDDGDGSLSTAEESALSDVILDAENRVEESIRKTYGLAGLTWLRGESTSAPRSIKRRCLDCVRIYIAERHPEYIRIDTDKAWQRFERDLEMMQEREIELAVIGNSEPEPAVNEGGSVYSGNEDDQTPADKVFLNGTGVF